ncbi:MAG: Piwi domain-containing protein [bacterium]|nr:Piwi domain-containing protein [bacterium]
MARRRQDVPKSIAINFFPVTTEHLAFTLYRHPFVEGKRPECSAEQGVMRRIEVEGSSHPFWTLFSGAQGGIETAYLAFDDAYATLDALRWAVLRSCQDNLPDGTFRILGGIRKRVEITLDSFREGKQVIALEPYFLRVRGKFGILASFRFRSEEEYRYTRRSQQLSLSLDRHGNENLSYYADVFSHLSKFVDRFHATVFPLTLPGGNKVAVSSRFISLEPNTLDVKQYVLGSSGASASQFMGVKQSGPFQTCQDDVVLYFIHRAQDVPLSRHLFRALRGDSFRTFPGMQRMFGLPLSASNVRHHVIESFDRDEIIRIRDLIAAKATGRTIVPVVVTPFGRFDAPEDNAPYWILKHAFLSEHLPIQVVTTGTLRDAQKLKWSTAGIALQIFAKAGGIPWKVRPRTEKCLIVGIGQAHRVTPRETTRYFAYSVLTDSSGIFEEVRVLGESPDEDRYLTTFAASLRQLLQDYSDRFHNVVVHTSFSIRRSEAEQIETVLAELGGAAEGRHFTVLKFNESDRFFGFAHAHNSLVPYESTVVPLSRREFLVWFEGLQYGQAALRRRVARPLHIRFTYPTELSSAGQEDDLQDAINLSGANWRGFNAKSLPVSIYYARLIARYLEKFDDYGLPPVDVSTLRPWFL